MVILLLLSTNYGEASIPVPGVILYGTVTRMDDSQVLSKDAVTVLAKASGSPVAHYVMGTISEAGNQYVLKIPLQADTGGNLTPGAVGIYVIEDGAETKAGEDFQIASMRLVQEHNLNLGGTSEAFTVGGTVATDPADPEGTGLAGVQVTLTGAGGAFQTTTGANGTWTIANVPAGTYAVPFNLEGYDFHDTGNLYSKTINVNADHQTENQSIEFWAEAESIAVVGDMNWDGFVSIIGDVPPFVQVVYFGGYTWYDSQFPGKNPNLPGDFNGDSILSIVGDVPGFVDCVYFGNCQEAALLWPLAVGKQYEYRRSDQTGAQWPVRWQVDHMGTYESTEYFHLQV